MNTKLNKTDCILIVAFYVISALMNCIDYYKRDHSLIEYFVDIPTATITSFCVVLLFMYWLIPNYLIKKLKYVQFIVFAVVVLCFFGSIEYIVGFWSGDNHWSKFPRWHNLILISISNASSDSGLIFGVLLTKKFYENQVHFFKVQKQQKENELKLLRSQIDPHFLFNNLNTLDALIDRDAIKAKEYINRLSLIYRYLILTKDAEVMELSEEINLAENYIYLMQTRFGKGYNFRIEKKVSLDDKFIPTGAIQTLLENVVKHNKAVHDTIIDVVIQIEEKWLTVRNDKYMGYSEEESFGTGLENLRTRYKLLSDTKIHITNTTSLFEVAIPIIKLSDES
ncbi:sensor histidine kinase [Aquimarina aquimarini]|uniref:sensor histidine kinase n=1 Tax=Aquimarina aquimarini TaxID=1191734 RepID=UPI000D556547|nr:histidine kinase [Aquimarina aquimarini]